MEKAEVIDYLTKLKDDFEDAFKMLENARSAVELSSVTAAYSKLKTHVAAENKRLVALERQNKLNEFEIAFLLPAVTEVYLHCTAAKNSKDKMELNSALYDGIDYCQYYLGQLNA